MGPGESGCSSSRHMTRPSSTRATERCGVENSSARILIGDLAGGGVGDFEVDVAEVEDSVSVWAIFGAEPIFGPFDDRDGIAWVEVIFESGMEDLIWIGEAVEVEVIEGAAAAFVGGKDGECGGVNAGGATETAGDAADEVGFTGAEVTGEGEHPAGLGFPAPLFTESESFFRAS